MTCLSQEPVRPARQEVHCRTQAVNHSTQQQLSPLVVVEVVNVDEHAFHLQITPTPSGMLQIRTY
jgi:hypothetical protein